MSMLESMICIPTSTENLLDPGEASSAEDTWLQECILACGATDRSARIDTLCTRVTCDYPYRRNPFLRFSRLATTVPVPTIFTTNNLWLRQTNTVAVIRHFVARTRHSLRPYILYNFLRVSNESSVGATSLPVAHEG